MLRTGERTRRAVNLSRVSIESLEQRLLYYSIDTSFGNQGYVTDIYSASARTDGSIIVGANKLLHPDGTPGPIIGTPAPVAVPQPSLDNQNVQADGRYYQADPKTGVTRYNKNGTIDKTFGVNGTVNSFIKNTPATSFTPQDVLVYKTQILVVGVGLLPYTDYDNPKPVYKSQVAVVRLKQDGSIDATYGTRGITWNDEATSTSFGSLNRSFLGPDGSLYIRGVAGPPQIDGQSLLSFRVDGRGSGFTWNTDDYSAATGLGPFAFEPNGRLVYAEAGSVYGPGGSVFLGGPFFSTPDSISLGVDGKVYVDSQGTLVCLRPDDPPSVTGRFFADNNADHKQDNGEPGLPYWQAYADLNNNGIFNLGEPTAFADVTGAYSINGLAPGSYHIREVRQSGWTRTTPAGAWPTGGVYTVSVVSYSKAVTGINFGNNNPVRTPGSISGTIFNDANGNKVRDAAEAPLAGWQAYADLNDNGVHDAGEPIATADKNGHYTLAKLAPGGYHIREIRHDGWARTTPPGNWPAGYFSIVLAPGQIVTGKDFGNAVGNSPLGTVTGIVYRDQNGNGKLDPGEHPAAGATVRLGATTLDLPQTDTITDANGRYTFTNVQPDIYKVMIYRSGFDDPDFKVVSPASGSATVTVIPSHTSQANFYVKPTASSVTGFVYLDVNLNGKIDTADFIAYPWIVYVDLNNNGQLDTNEPTWNDKFDGGDPFSFTSDGPGTFTLRLIPPPGYKQVVPAGGAGMKVTFFLGEVIKNANFLEIKAG